MTRIEFPNLRRALIIPLLMIWLTGCDKPAPLVVTSEQPALAANVNSDVVTPLPQHIQLNAKQVELGRRLFFDTRLSQDNTVSCAHCHPISNYGVYNQRVSVGIHGQLGIINAPTVLNSGFNFRQFWNGRAASLEEQVNGPVNNPVEMGANWPVVIGKLSQDAQLKLLSKQAYGKPIDKSVVLAAIAVFERSLVTPDAPFDRYLRGDKTAISVQAQDGWQLFKQLGCASCHQGMNVGGNMYEKIGVMANFFNGRPLQPTDYGLYAVTHEEQDKFKFKVPSLRNVAKTAPYFHDGSATTLPKAVNTMARVQLGLTLTQQQNDEIVAFLESLAGTLPKVQP